MVAAEKADVRGYQCKGGVWQALEKAEYDAEATHVTPMSLHLVYRTLWQEKLMDAMERVCVDTASVDEVCDTSHVCKTGRAGLRRTHYGIRNTPSL